MDGCRVEGPSLWRENVFAVWNCRDKTPAKSCYKNIAQPGHDGFGLNGMKDNRKDLRTRTDYMFVLPATMLPSYTFT